MRAFYLIYANDSDDLVPKIEAELGRFLIDVATVKSGTQEFLEVVHSWEKSPAWDWLKEMPHAKTGRFAITGGFGEVPWNASSALITKINQQTGVEQAARFQVCTVGVKGNPYTPFNVPTYWELR
jgi:hypothetical protein